jgi:sugar O-acyltransferase (sialic acid O-acetyltransferase NeuD family)
VSQPQALFIFPCNGNAIEALDCLGATDDFVAFIDDSPQKQGTYVHGYQVLNRSALQEFPHARLLAVPGGPASFRWRKQVIESLNMSSERYTSVIHASARISDLARIGHNVLIMAGAVVTSNAVIGNHVCILPNTVIHHDVVIEAWSLIGSNVTIAGNTSIGENCYIGSGSSVKNGLSIGDGVMIGLASNVIRDVLPGATVAGNPARIFGTTGAQGQATDRGAG